MAFKDYNSFINVEPQNAGLKVGGTTDSEIVVTRQELRDYVDSEQVQDPYLAVNSDGSSASAGGDNAIAIGESADAGGDRAIAVGLHSGAEGDDSIHMGSQDTDGGGVDPEAHRGISIGHGALVAGNATDGIALGSGTDVKSGHHSSIALGIGAQTTESQQLVIGGPDADSSIHNIQTPHFKPTSGEEFVTIDSDGNWGISEAPESIYLDVDGTGAAANATGTETIALGPGGTTATGNSSLAIGHNSQTEGAQAIAIGENTEAHGPGAIAIGENSNAHGTQSIHIGTGDNNYIRANSLRSIAMGHDSRVDSDASYSMAIGATARVSEGHSQSIALGRGAVTDTDNQLVIGHSSVDNLSINHIKTPGFKASSGTDVISVDTDGNWVKGGISLDYVKVNSTGTDASATGGNSIAIGASSSATDSEAIAIGTVSNASAENAVALGFFARATNEDAVAIGKSTVANGSEAITIGMEAAAYSDGSIALGRKTTVSPSHTRSIALGYEAETTQDRQLMIGTDLSSESITSIVTPGLGQTVDSNGYIAIDTNGNWSVDTDVATREYVDGEFADSLTYVLINSDVTTYNNNISVANDTEAYIDQGYQGHTLIWVGEPHDNVSRHSYIKVQDLTAGNYSIYKIKYTSDFHNGGATQFTCVEEPVFNSSGSEVSEDAATFRITVSGGESFSIGYGLTHDSESGDIVVDTETIADTEWVKDYVSSNRHGYVHFFTDRNFVYRYPTNHDVGHGHFASNGSDIRWYGNQEDVFDTDLNIGSTIRITFRPSDPLEEDTIGLYNVDSTSYDSLDDLYTVSLDFVSGTDVLGDHDDAIDTENMYFIDYSDESIALRPFDGYHSGYVQNPTGDARRNRNYYLNATGGFSEVDVGGGRFVEVNGNSADSDADASGGDAIAIGVNTRATDNNTIAIGSEAQATHRRSVAIGHEATTTSRNQLVIGGTGDSEDQIKKIYTPGFTDTQTGIKRFISVDTDGKWSIEQPEENKYFEVSSTNLGAFATDTDSLAVGPLSFADGKNGVAIGARAQVSGENSIAIGANSGDSDRSIVLQFRTPEEINIENSAYRYNLVDAKINGEPASADNQFTIPPGIAYPGTYTRDGVDENVVDGLGVLAPLSANPEDNVIDRPDAIIYTSKNNFVTNATYTIIIKEKSFNNTISFRGLSDTDSELSFHGIKTIRTPGFTGGSNQYIAVDANGVWTTETVSSGGGGFNADTDRIEIGSGATVDSSASYGIALGTNATTDTEGQLVIGSGTSSESIHHIKTPHFRPNPLTPDINFVTIDTDGNWGIGHAGGSHQNIVIENSNGDTSPLTIIKHNTDGTVVFNTVDSEYAGDDDSEHIATVALTQEGGIDLIINNSDTAPLPFDTDLITYIVTDTYTYSIQGSYDSVGALGNTRIAYRWNNPTHISGKTDDTREKYYSNHTLVSVHQGKLGFTAADTDWVKEAYTGGDGINISSSQEVEVDDGFGLNFDSNRELQVDTSQIATHNYVQSAVRNATRGEIGNRTDEHTLYLTDNEHDQLRFENNHSISDNHSFIVNTRGDTVYQGIAARDDDLFVVQVTDGSSETVLANSSRNWEAVQYGVYEGNRWDESDAFTYNSQAFKYTGDAPTTIWNNDEGVFSNVTFYRNGHNSSSRYQVTARVQLGIVDDLSHVRSHDDFHLVAQSEEFSIELTSGESQITVSSVRIPGVDSDNGVTIQPDQYVAVRWAIHIDHFDDTGVSLTDAPYLVWSGTGNAQRHHAGRADVRTVTYELYLDPADGTLKYGNNTKTPEDITTIVDTDGFITNDAQPFVKINGSTDSEASASASGAIAIGQGATTVDHSVAIALGRNATATAFHQLVIGGTDNGDRIDSILTPNFKAPDSAGSSTYNVTVDTEGNWAVEEKPSGTLEDTEGFGINLATVGGKNQISVDTTEIASVTSVSDKQFWLFDTDVNRYGVGTGSSSNIIELDTNDTNYSVLSPDSNATYTIYHSQRGHIVSIAEVDGGDITAVASDGLENAKWQWLTANQTVIHGSTSGFNLITDSEQLFVLARVTETGGGGATYTQGYGINATKFADSEIAVDTDVIANRQFVIDEAGKVTIRGEFYSADSNGDAQIGVEDETFNYLTVDTDNEIVIPFPEFLGEELLDGNDTAIDNINVEDDAQQYVLLYLNTTDNNIENTFLRRPGVTHIRITNTGGTLNALLDVSGDPANTEQSDGQLIVEYPISALSGTYPAGVETEADNARVSQPAKDFVIADKEDILALVFGPETAVTQREAAQKFKTIGHHEVGEYSRLRWNDDNTGYQIWFDTEYDTNVDATHNVEIVQTDADSSWILRTGATIGSGTFVARRRKTKGANSVFTYENS